MSSYELIPVESINRMAIAMAKSGLFGVKSPDQAMALMLVAQAEGMHPAAAVRDFHIIQGRPALKADAMLARFQRAGGRVRWTKLTDTEVEAEFSHEAGGTVRISWTLEMAKRAGLAGRDTWKQYPRQMLRARCVSEGIRTVFPGVLAGFYTPEEVVDFDAKPPKDMGPADIVEPEPAAPDDDEMPPPDQDEIDDVRAEIAACNNIEELRKLWSNTYPDVRGILKTQFDAKSDELKKPEMKKPETTEVDE